MPEIELRFYSCIKAQISSVFIIDLVLHVFIIHFNGSLIHIVTQVFEITQGYLISKPCSPAELPAIFERYGSGVDDKYTGSGDAELWLAAG